jgi:hypothetical protein
LLGGVTQFLIHDWAGGYAGSATSSARIYDFLRRSPNFFVARASQDHLAKDDATMPNEMSVEAKLDLLVKSVSSIEGRLDKIDGRLAKVDTELGAAKIRDEELRGLMKLGLEATEGLREVIDDRFARIDQKLDDESKLLRQAIRRNIPPGSGAHSAR